MLRGLSVFACMDIHITKAQLRERLGAETTDADIARFFSVSTSAIAQWPEDRPIPEKRALQARLKRPDLFSEAA